MPQQHRSINNYNYSGIPIHAGIGLHEKALELCELNIPKGSFILELGSGSGAFTKRLIDSGYQVISCDIDPAGYALETNAIKIDLNLDFSSHFSEFDFKAIVCLEIIEHLENPQHFLRELFKLSKIDTKVFISFPNVYLHSSIRNFLFTGQFASWNKNQYWDMGHQTILTDWLFEAHCKKYGFKVLNKMFVAEMDFRKFYPNPFKRLIVYLFVHLFNSISRFFNKNILKSDCVIFQIAKK